MPTQGFEQARMALLDLLERHASRLLHQVDEAEVPGAKNDHLAAADVVLGALVSRRGATRGLVESLADRGVVLVAAGQSSHGAGLERALDELVEAVAVALLEGGPLCLAVIGEDDELVGPGCVATRA